MIEKLYLRVDRRLMGGCQIEGHQKIEGLDDRTDEEYKSLCWCRMRLYSKWSHTTDNRTDKVNVEYTEDVDLAIAIRPPS